MTPNAAPTLRPVDMDLSIPGAPSLFTRPMSTAAAAEARENWHRNLGALRQTQPSLVESLSFGEPGVTWMYGRDGALTVLENGRWWSNCSLPRRAAQAMLSKLHVSGAVACFPSPSHAATVSVALQRLSRQQAIITIYPAAFDLVVALHCVDFSADIAAHRAWFIAGDDWPAALCRLLADVPGLPVPQQIIRTARTNDQEFAQFSIPIQQALSDENSRRNQLLQDFASLPRRTHDRVGVIAGSTFHLLNDAAAVLVSTLSTGQPGFSHLDPDDPSQTSSLALAAFASECDALVTANLTRTELPPVIPPAVPLITWITGPRIPAASAAHPRDALLLADAAWLPMAAVAGWKRDRLAVAAWPTNQLPASSCESHLAIIADTRDVTTAPTFDLSSHRLLWELLQDQLSRYPFAFSTAPTAFLTAGMRQLGIAPETLDTRRFIDERLLPLWQHAIVRLLIAAKLPIKIHGHHWPAEFSPYLANSIHNRHDLFAAAGASRALIHLWPGMFAHPLDAMSRPVLRCARFSSASSLVSEARKLLTSAAPAPATSPLTPGLIRQFL
jgi:hypothetical protein